MDNVIDLRTARPLEGCTIVDGLNICDTCGKPRNRRLPTDMGGLIVPAQCDCKLAEERERKIAERKVAVERNIDRLRHNGLVDPRYLRHTFDQDAYPGSEASKLCRGYVRNWADMERKHWGILFNGPIGRGKSFYAACIANALIDRGVSVLYTSFPLIMDAFQDEMKRNRGYDDYSSVLADLMKPRLLIIDDLGVERRTSYALEKTYLVIETRYKSDKPLIVTTNLPLKELQREDTEDARINDRVLAMCPLVLTMTGKNERKARADNARRDMIRKITQ